MGKKDLFTRFFDPTEHVTKREKDFLEGFGSIIIGGCILALFYMGTVFIYNIITDTISYTINFIISNFFWIKIYSYTIFFINTLNSSIRSYEFFKHGFKNEYNSPFALIKGELKIFLINYIAFFMLPIIAIMYIVAILILLFLFFLIFAILSDQLSIIDSFTIDSYFNFLNKSWDFVFKQK
ncbi:MAG: hypothetical protein ACJZ8X_00120 [Candidatus Puniceispirillales bacterium]